VIVWVRRDRGGKLAVRVLGGGPSYAVDEVTVDGEPVGGRVRELLVEAEEVRFTVEEGRARVAVATRSHAIASELADVLGEVPVRVGL
jgi:hypothetical protein